VGVVVALCDFLLGMFVGVANEKEREREEVLTHW
jgi:hypothetical protein